MELVGFVDSFRPPQTLSGWIVSRVCNARDVLIRVRKDGRIIAEARPDRDRQGLDVAPELRAGFTLVCCEEICDQAIVFDGVEVTAHTEGGHYARLPFWNVTQAEALTRLLPTLNLPVTAEQVPIVLQWLSGSPSLPTSIAQAIKACENAIAIQVPFPLQLGVTQDEYLDGCAQASRAVVAVSTPVAGYPPDESRRDRHLSVLDFDTDASSQMFPRIAILVLAYRYPIGLSALSTYFAAINADIFVHVDAKMDERPFRTAIEGAPASVTFIEDRVRVFWRGFTMVEATIKLLKAAQSRLNYERFVIISDDTLPLVAPSEFISRMRNEGDFLTARVVGDPLKARYEQFFMFDSEATQVRWIPIVERIVTPGALSRFERLGALFKRGKKPLDAYYHGSQWMALEATSVRAVLDSWDTDDWLRESFEFSEVPDEAYIQTILSQRHGPTWRVLTHVEWSGPSPPRVFRSPGELSGIDTKGALLVRKIDFDTDGLKSWVANLMHSKANEISGAAL